jgi:hypothetical protein
MDLPFFNFVLHIVDETWRKSFENRFEVLYKPFLDSEVLTSDEYLNISYLLESWISTMIYHATFNEKATAEYEEFRVSYKFPRFAVSANVTIYR